MKTKPRRKKCGYFWRIQKGLKTLANQNKTLNTETMEVFSEKQQKYIIKNSLNLNIIFIQTKRKKK